MYNINNALSKQKKILEDRGYRVAYICIYGSQNYNLDVNTEEYQSDLDMKAVVVPNLDNLINNSKPVSKVVDTEWGQCDIKDIRVYFQTLLKANPAYLETLYSKYFLVDGNFEEQFDQVFKLRDDLVHAIRAQMVRAIYGMMCEKQKALTYPYPSIAHKIEKYGYDGKQSHHIFRLYGFMRDYYGKKKTFQDSLLVAGDWKDLLMKHKLNKLELDEVQLDVKEIMDLGRERRNEILDEIDEQSIDYSIKDIFINLSRSIIKNKIIHEIRSV